MVAIDLSCSLPQFGSARQGRNASGNTALQTALTPLLGQIDISTMREANLRAAGGDGTSSPDAVARWLWDKIGKR